MPYRLTKIYTRKGDKGFTSLGKKRVAKHDALIEALGTIDELNAVLGLVITLQIKDKTIETCLTEIQNHLFDVGGELYKPEKIVITADHVKALENQLDGWNQSLPPLKEFLLPRGNPTSAACHIARTVCRRAERCLVRLHQQAPLSNPELLRYINRLSDLLFVMARVLARESKQTELMWEH